MPIVSGVITRPVSTDDVKQSFGIVSNDVGYLCSNNHGQTNMWSKFKPIHFADTVVPLTDAQYKTALYGLTYRTSNAFLDVLYTGWTYNPPTGGAASPYRLTDFERYYHNAKTFLNKNQSITWYSQTNQFTYFSLNYNDTNTLYELSRDDLFQSTALSDYYLAVILWDIQLTPNYYIKTASAKVGLNGWDQIQAANSELPFVNAVGTTTYRYSFILCSRQYNTFTRITNGGDMDISFIGLPYVEASDNQANLVQYNVTQLMVIWKGIASTNVFQTTVTGTKQDINKYLPTSGTQEYFTVASSGNLGISVDITNYTNFSQTLAWGGVTVDLEPGLNEQLKNSNAFQIYAWSPSTGARYTSDIVVGANSTITVVLGLENLMNIVYENGTNNVYNQAQGYQGAVRFEITWNGNASGAVTINPMSEMIRFKSAV